MSFRAIQISKTDQGQKVDFVTLEDSVLTDGDVLIEVSHSSVNYKDGLAVTGKAPIIRKYPLIPGIDLAGTVRESTHPGWKAGDQVVLNGWGVGEQHNGGYAELARIPGDWLVPVPKGWTTADCMAVGVAGYTAMLSVMALEHHGLTPESGPIIVTGAAGGVGSVAIALLAKAGFRVVAATGRESEAAYLQHLGAAEIVSRASLSGPVKPIAKETYAGGVDSVGSTILANVLSMIKYGGAVAACGLAGGRDLPTSVTPFILRGVCLLGIDSVMCPLARREAAWERLSRDLDRSKLVEMTKEITLDQVPAEAEKIVAGQVRGRIVVRIG